LCELIIGNNTKVREEFWRQGTKFIDITRKEVEHRGLPWPLGLEAKVWSKDSRSTFPFRIWFVEMATTKVIAEQAINVPLFGRDERQFVFSLVGYELQEQLLSPSSQYPAKYPVTTFLQSLYTDLPKKLPT
jgi:hypothetical protein